VHESDFAIDDTDSEAAGTTNFRLHGQQIGRLSDNPFVLIQLAKRAKLFFTPS
jgi:hypothetical protein